MLPLTYLTWKDIAWNWSADCENAFKSLKSAFTTVPVLAHWDPTAQIIVETDVSDSALAAILSTYKDNKLHPLAFQAAEQNYDVYNKELLAIFEAFKRWRHYLEGTPVPVEVFTNHRNLEYFCESKALTRRQACWSEFLSQFNLKICFRPGRLGTKPNALTRRWDVYSKENLTTSRTTDSSNFRPLFTSNQLPTALRASYLPNWDSSWELVLDLFTLNQNIKDALPLDPLSAKLLDKPSAELVSPWSKDNNGQLLYQNHLFVPDVHDLRLRVLHTFYDHILVGYPGQTKTQQLVRREFAWPKLKPFVADFMSSCNVCSRNKSRRHKLYGPLMQLPISSQPWESISIDFIEQLPPSQGYTDILVIIDRLTKQAIFVPTHNTINAQTLSELFVLHVFSKHSIPSHVTSDRGPEFISTFFRSLATSLQMNLYFTSGHHPEANGQSERTNQTLEQYLRSYYSYQQDDWSKLLPLAEFAFNNAPSASTGVSPFFTNKGYHPRL